MHRAAIVSASHTQAINPAAGARRKGSPCRRREGERAWSSPRSPRCGLRLEHDNGDEVAAVHVHRRGQPWEDTAPPSSVPGGWQGRDSTTHFARRRLHHAHEARGTELRGAAFGRPPMLFRIGLRLSLLVEERMRAPTPCFSFFASPNPSSPRLLV
jgi:hypothetical protein